MAVGSNPASNLAEQNGKIRSSSDGNSTCHQCRHKAMGLVASCKNKKKNKPCTTSYCKNCLLNRYGEKVEEVTVLEDWFCPKCRGICNCSCCRKKQGHQPTGRLVHTAKATGFSSVSELLRVKGLELAVALPKQWGKENSVTENSNSNLNLDEKKQKRMKQEGLKEIQDSKRRKSKTNAMKFHKEDFYASMPQGTELTSVSGIELPPKDAGHALQFLEFCAAFREASELASSCLTTILDLKDGEPEYVLGELKRGGPGCRGKHSPVVWFHIQLLSLIQKNLGEKSPVITTKNGKNSWLHALQNFASRSQYVLGKLKLEQFGGEFDDYDRLEFSEKLRLLNSLCDEFLCTAKIRSWIDDQNSKLAEKVKEANERVVAAKHKEKQLKQKMQDEVAEAIIAKSGAPLSISEHEAIVTQIKTKAAQAHAEILESKGMVTKEKQRADAVRRKPILLDASGRIYWRLKGYSDKSNLLLQDVGSSDTAGLSEKWYTFNAEQEKEIEKYIHSSRKRGLRPQKLKDVPSSSSSEADIIQSISEADKIRSSSEADMIL
ncbi:hypothetical protein RHGRI_028735 [Rhododendron griersonianum]|uniref:Zinc-finger domain-containing protein n=2 Tax=Rhododendron griersonianum TaxID=479676 RepID=A0AAV6IKP4_9ERIC|nr:hypothetical protein RHGRI_028735 [Rhododendron griersonianum]